MLDLEKMSIVPYGYQLNSEYSNYSSFPTEGSSPPTSASAMSQINWQATYPSQIAPVNTAMSTLFPPYSRGSSQKVSNIKTVVFLFVSDILQKAKNNVQVDIHCKWIMPHGHHCGKYFQYMCDVVHHITMDHVGGPGKNLKTFHTFQYL